MNKKFKELYDFCQRLPCPPSISRNLICGKVQEIMGQHVKIVKHGLDTNVLRGLFLSGQSASRFVKQNGGNPVVVLARGMPEEWDRLVQVKEIMHLFDEDDEMTSSADQLEELLNSLTAPSRMMSPQVRTEFEAVYMALACYCPEPARQQFIKDIEAGHTEEYEVALKLRLPQQYVKTLLTPHFGNVVEQILS